MKCMYKKMFNLICRIVAGFLLKYIKHKNHITGIEKSLKI